MQHSRISLPSCCSCVQSLGCDCQRNCRLVLATLVAFTVVNNSVEITTLELGISCNLGIFKWSLLWENRPWMHAFPALSTPSSSSKCLSCIWQSFDKEVQHLNSTVHHSCPLSHDAVQMFGVFGGFFWFFVLRKGFHF